MYKPNNVRLTYYIGWVFYALFLSEVSWSPFVLVILKRWLSSWVKTAQQDFCIDENRFIFTDWIIMNKNTLKCATVQWKTLHILPGVVVHSDHLFVFVFVFILALLAFCSPAVLRDFEVSSNKESSTPIARPIARTRKMPFMPWALRDEPLALSGKQLLAHHLVRRYASSPASLSCRMATLRFFSIGDPVPKILWHYNHSLQQRHNVFHRNRVMETPNLRKKSLNLLDKKYQKSIVTLARWDGIIWSLF